MDSCNGLTGQIAAFLRRARARAPTIGWRCSPTIRIEHLACYLGVMAYGATICTIHVEMNRRHLDHILPMLGRAWCCPRRGRGSTTSWRRPAAPYLALGSWDDQRGDGFFAAGQPLRRRATPWLRASPRGRRGHPVHLRHQRVAQGRGADVPRAPVQHRADRATASASTRRIASTISAPSTGAPRSC